jgi:6-pyruvoyltetrahydropterin/6-carboxytetrahydropterin synthase
MFELEVTEKFDAAHHLPHPEAGQCNNMHGHTYKVTVRVTGELQPAQGWVANLKTIREYLRNLLGNWDHAILNNVGLPNPTAELMAQYICSEMQKDLRRLKTLNLTCASVSVQEGEGGIATYYAG